MRLALRKSGVRPIIPHVARAQCRIMTRRRARSSWLRGVMNDRPTRSPVVGDRYVIWSRTFEGTLHVIYVVDNLAGRLAFGEATLAGTPLDLQADIEAAGRRSLEAAIADDDRRELHAVPVLRTSTSPSKEIVTYAKEAAIDIVIVGATGRGMLDRMLMGSVADKVVRTAPCPVLAVRNPEHEFVVPDALQAVARPNV